MLYDVNSPEEYLSVLEDDWRKEKLLEVRALILSLDPDMVEGIDCKMLGYSLYNKPIFNLNAQSAYVSFYVGNIQKVKNGRELLEPFNVGKGCIRIKKRIQIKETQLEQFIRLAIEQVKQGGDISC